MANCVGCYALAFDGPPAQRACGICGRAIDTPIVPLPTVRIGARGPRYHTQCWLFGLAPSAKAGMLVN